MGNINQLCMDHQSKWLKLIRKFGVANGFLMHRVVQKRDYAIYFARQRWFVGIYFKLLFVKTEWVMGQQFCWSCGGRSWPWPWPEQVIFQSYLRGKFPRQQVFKKPLWSSKTWIGGHGQGWPTDNNAERRQGSVALMWGIYFHLTTHIWVNFPRTGILKTFSRD